MARKKSGKLSPLATSISATGRARRIQNYVLAGLGYAVGYYVNRYNLGIADKPMGDALGLNKVQMGDVKGWGKLAYALSALFCGPGADRRGGRKTMLYGFLGVSIAGLLFVVAAYAPRDVTNVLRLMTVAWILNNFFQAFGALSIIAINRKWLREEERPMFSGIFGAIIQTGRLLIWGLGVVALGYKVPWYWLFVIPSGLSFLFFFIVKRWVAETPEDAGIDYQVDEGPPEPKPKLWEIAWKVITTAAVLKIAVAEFCTGFVRNGTDEWFVRYMIENFGVNIKSAWVIITAVISPLAAIAGGMAAGWVSKHWFQSRAAPVVTLAYVGQAICMWWLGHIGSPREAAVLIVINSFFVQVNHSLLMGVSSMKFGGRHGAATAAGIFDACQYFAGAVGGFVIGRLVQHWGWIAWSVALTIFPVVGALIMATLWNNGRPAISRPKKSRRRKPKRRAKR